MLKYFRRRVSYFFLGSKAVAFLKFVPPQHCTQVTDFRILDWHLLPCVITFSEVLNALPGYLNWNSHETLPLKANPWSFTSFVNRHISSETPDWSEGKLLCKRCVLKLIGRHTLNSLREIKAQRRSSSVVPYSGIDRTSRLEGPQLEDCWYGYRCRTQRRHDHAAKLNVCDVVVLVTVV